MRIERRELFRQFGVAAATTAILPSLGRPTVPVVDFPGRMVRLNRNESAYGPCEKAKAAFRESAAEVNRYPAEDLDNLREAIAVLHGVRAENITLGCGSGELLRMAADTMLGAGKSLVLATPTFDSIGHTGELLGAEVRAVPLTHVYAHDLDAMLARIDATTSLVYICNPNNPTGTLTPKTDIQAFLRKVPLRIPILIDEAYHEYVAPTGAYESWAARAAADGRLIVTRTFSKAYGLAGVRVGYAVSSAEMAKRLSARRLPMGVNVVGARVALAALSDADHVGKITLQNSNDRQEFYNQANARMLRSLDSQTNFVLLATGRSGKEVAEQLKARGVLVATGYPSFERHIRVSLGTPEEMQAFWRAWDGFMPRHVM